jgi:two-component system, cell cycle sensor histidine kinase and response regulator CckA
MRALLIEDNEDDVCLIREMLSDAKDVHIEVDWADHLSLGLTRLTQGKTDLVLLDLSLPDSHGLETFTRVQAQARDLPIIVLTGLDDEAIADRAVRKGAQDYLVKGRLDSYILSRAARHAVERKQAENALHESEAQLRQAQKMETIGRLTGGIAHDFNNLLTVINSYSDMLLGEPGLGHGFIRTGLEEIKDAGHRAAALTRQLLAFSRCQILEPKVLDLNEVVANMARLLRRLIGEDISLALCPDPLLGRIQADPGQVEQIIMNLAVNARDAMPGGGRLTVETRNIEVDGAVAPEGLSMPAGAYVLLSVSDTGCGMTEETLEEIFKPFFTTKEAGKGTGLGLATLDSIVKHIGGGVSVSSELHKGTTFRVYLPRVEDQPIPVTLSSTPNEALRGSEAILLVEDDEMVRALTQAILERYGYAVVASRSVYDALAFVQEDSRTFHMLLTDTIMPGMNGQELADRVLSIRPDMKVLYMSGYTDNVFARTGTGEPGTAFLQKPFTPHTLAHKVREILTHSGERAS